MNRCLLEQCNNQVSLFEVESLDVSRSVTSIEDAKELLNEKSQISDDIFSTGLKISNLLFSATEASTTPVKEGVHVPKISVPTFDGHILQWRSCTQQGRII